MPENKFDQNNESDEQNQETVLPPNERWSGGPLKPRDLDYMHPTGDKPESNADQLAAEEFDPLE